MFRWGRTNATSSRAKAAEEDVARGRERCDHATPVNKRLWSGGEIPRTGCIYGGYIQPETHIAEQEEAKGARKAPATSDDEIEADNNEGGSGFQNGVDPNAPSTSRSAQANINEEQPRAHKAVSDHLFLISTHPQTQLAVEPDDSDDKAPVAEKAKETELGSVFSSVSPTVTSSSPPASKAKSKKTAKSETRLSESPPESDFDTSIAPAVPATKRKTTKAGRKSVEQPASAPPASPEPESDAEPVPTSAPVTSKAKSTKTRRAKQELIMAVFKSRSRSKDKRRGAKNGIPPRYLHI
ncbi:hypothetical protein FRC12_020176 [Ceratobasidium sp. 428]|nr:hypothetical protein FRC12_020176 [Ceratobasidium sp. 428]